MTFLDALVITAYGVLVLGLGLYAARSHQQAGDLLLGNRSMPTWAVLFSMVATELSAATFIGVPHAAYVGTWSYLQFAFGALAGKLVLGAFVIPLYHRKGFVTVYGLLDERFGSRARTLAALAFVMGRVLASGVRLFIAALAFSAVTDLSLTSAIVLSALIAGAYTLVGGIRSVIWTDVVQGVVFVAAVLCVIVVLAIHPLGGLPEIATWAQAQGRMEIFTFSPALSLSSARPFLVGLIGGFFLTLATHGTDHDMVQRLLTTSSGRAGGRALMGSALLNFPLTALFLFVGTGIAYVLQTPPAYDIGDTARIFPIFAFHELPSGARGLLFAGLFAAAMSSFDSAVCAIATTVCSDVLPATKDAQALVKRMRLASIGCCAALALAAIAISKYHAALVQGQAAGATFSLVDLALSAMTILYGGLLGVFAVAVLMKRRGSDASALAGIVSGSVTGALLFLHPLLRDQLGGLEIAWPWWIPISATVSFGVTMMGRSESETFVVADGGN
ncbi:MAG: hypothetical protein JRC77_00155 [Deltaproteobacteria bacterium]|nr:hypothetical protein [Deltaproteobacteria bacterium]